MAILTIRWSEPQDSNWTFSRVYRASSKNGTYSLQASIAIGTYSYEDPTGSSASWYKVSFFDGVNESSLSDPVRGGTSANYCTLTEFRSISPFSKSEMSDVDVIALMPIASRIVHRKIVTKRLLVRDFIGPVDGTNTIFYVKQRPLADMNMDSSVDEDDVQVFYATLDSNNRRVYGSAQTVSSVDARSGRVTMSTAPTSITAIDGVYMTYGTTVEDLDYSEVRTAANYLLAHLVSVKVRGETPNYTMIEAAFVRMNAAGINPRFTDKWQQSFLTTAVDIIREIMGTGRSGGIGFARVDAEER